jgi:hypothetical protein
VAVKATGTSQRRVEHIHAIGRAENYDPFCTGEPIHLHQQLIQGLICFHLATAAAGIALAACRVDLVNKNNAGGFGTCFLE